MSEHARRADGRPWVRRLTRRIGTQTYDHYVHDGPCIPINGACSCDTPPRDRGNVPRYETTT